MSILVKVMIVLLQVIYSGMNLQKTKNRIVFITRQSNTTTEDFRLLVEQIGLDKPEIECVVLAKTLPKTATGKAIYSLHMLKQMYYMASSKVVVLDTYCIVASILKHRDELTIIQIWHALGAFKKFGYSALGSKEGRSHKMAKLLQMHAKYDYVIASSEYCRKFYSEAFNIDIKNIEVYPLPRLDNLKKQAHEKSEESKRVLYVPTFRKNNADISDVVNEIAKSLKNSKYNLVVKLHPLSDSNDEYGVVDNEKSLSELLQWADIVITDYSSVIFEAAYLEKKIHLYAYDYEEYRDGRDFYFAYEKELPYEICFNLPDLVQGLDKNSGKNCTDFVNRYIGKSNTTYTKDLSDFIVNKM